MALSTVSRWLQADRPRASCRGSSRRSRPTATSESGAGELVHVDVKKLGRIRLAGRRAPRNAAAAQTPGQPHRRQPAGSSSTSAVDDHYPPRLRRGARATSAARPPRLPADARSGGFDRHGDHGRAGDERQRRLLRLDSPRSACRALGLRHLRTRPYRPRTNGKAERFIQTLLAAGPTEPSTATPNRTHRSTTRLARPLQLHPTPWLPRPRAAQQPHHRPPEQPPRVLHLARGSGDQVRDVVLAHDVGDVIGPPRRSPPGALGWRRRSDSMPNRRSSTAQALSSLRSSRVPRSSMPPRSSRVARALAARLDAPRERL